MITLLSVAFLVSSVISFAIQIKRIEFKDIAGWSRKEKGAQEWYGERAHGWFGRRKVVCENQTIKITVDQLI